MKPRVYLAGPIRTNIAVDAAWRAVAERSLEEQWHVLNPARDQVYTSHETTINGVDADPHLITQRSFAMVQRADIVLANFYDLSFADDYPCIGTMCELGYAHAKQIPIVTIVNDQWHHRGHPMLAALPMVIFVSLEDALEFLSRWGDSL